jgi:transposase InsO family protein
MFTYEKRICTLQLFVHSDRGCHYHWPGRIERMEQAQLQCSMPKKRCSPDNFVCEGFFGYMKSEMFYGCSWTNASLKILLK